MHLTIAMFLKEGFKISPDKIISPSLTPGYNSYRMKNVFDQLNNFLICLQRLAPSVIIEITPGGHSGHRHPATPYTQIMIFLCRYK